MGHQRRFAPAVDETAVDPVAAIVWNRWSRWIGTDARLQSESLPSFNRIPCSPSIGFGDRNERNTQTDALK